MHLRCRKKCALRTASNHREWKEEEIKNHVNAALEALGELKATHTHTHT